MRNCFKVIVIPAILLSLVFCTGCGDDEKENPTDPGVKLGSMGATINGTPWVAFNTAAAVRLTGQTQVVGTGLGLLGADTCAVGFIFDNPAVGTLQLGGEINFVNSFTVQIGSGSSYSTIHADAAGTAVITSLTANRITGTFSFSAYPSSGPDSVKVANGLFDLPIYTF